MSEHDPVRAALERALSDEPAMPPVADDLARARAAAAGRSRRRFRIGLAATSLVVVTGVGATAVLTQSGPGTGEGGDPGTGQRITLLAMPMEATPYTFDLTPQGWSVQAQGPTAVTIVPDDGSTSADPNDFQGKLVILFDRNPLDGTPVSADGRRIWVGGDTDYTIMSTPTRPDEPSGVVRIQFPDDAGWSRASMLRFLASVHVGPGAEPGLG